MDILSPLILLHQNGYKAITEIAGGEDLGLAMVEVQGNSKESFAKTAVNAVAEGAKTVRSMK
jgi:hypothetical protein